jgi:hypothetical protein
MLHVRIYKKSPNINVEAMEYRNKILQKNRTGLCKNVTFFLFLLTVSHANLCQNPKIGRELQEFN